MQSSANLSGSADARTLDEVPARACAKGADLVLDGGELPGVPSTVVDLRELAAGRRAGSVLREGAARRRATVAARPRQAAEARWIAGWRARPARRC